MNALLYFPGIVVVFILAAGRDQAIRSVFHILQIQVSLCVSKVFFLIKGSDGFSIRSTWKELPF